MEIMIFVWSCMLWACAAQLYDEPDFNDTIPTKTLEMTMMTFKAVPSWILKDHPDITALQLNHNKIRYVGNHDFPKNACLTLRYINLNGNQITKIEEDAFSNMPQLLELDLSENLLTEVPKIKAPNLRKIHMDKNLIEKVSPEAMKHYKKVYHLDLSENKIEQIEANTFSENKILFVTDLSDNPLKRIDDTAFKGAHDLNILRLKNTKLQKLPAEYGINTIEILDITNNPDLFTIPDPSKFKKLKKVSLTYSMHCCAFKAKREALELNNTRPCPTGPSTSLSPKSKRGFEVPANDSTNKEYFEEFGNSNQSMPIFGDMFKDVLADMFNYGHEENYSLCSGMGELVGEPLDTHVQIKCTPEPNAFNPCQDVMGTPVLRGFSWIIAVLAVFGNIFQLIILFYSRQEFTVYKLLMYNLGVSNLLMGVYLLVLCIVDAYTYGEYYNYVQMWQFNGGCQTFGFVALFATSLSVCCLLLITLERYLLIIFALSIGNQMKLRHAKIGVALAWLYSFVIAVLPVKETVSSYSRIAICLPLDTASSVSKGYLVSLLSMYVIAFVLIVICYLRMYDSISRVRPGIPNTQNIDIKVAKRMALIIFSNFLCWLPISGVGLFAMYSGLDDVKVAKFLIVFVFPLNACTNPFLYAVFTKVFRADTLRLLSRCGLVRNPDQEDGSRTSYFKRPKNKARTSTNSSHFMHIQSPNCFSGAPSRDVGEMEEQTEFNEASKVMVDSPQCSDKPLESFNHDEDILEERFRSESSETASTALRASPKDEFDEDDYSKLGCSLHESSVLLTAEKA